MSVRSALFGAPTPQKRLRKDLTLFDVYAISTGAMFSSGFFLLPGLAAAMTGPSVPLAYLAAGVFMLPAMFSVAELATAMPRAGGAYYFLDRSMGPLIGTVGGLGTWMALVLKSAFALVGMGAYLAIFLDIPIKPLAIVLTLLFALVNIVGAKETGGLQRILVTCLLVIMAFFVVQGLAEVFSRGIANVTSTRFTPFLPFGLRGFMATAGLVFVSYAGLTKVASISEEVENPDRNIPLGMILSLLTAAFVYTVGVYLIVAVLDPTELRGDLTPVATAAAAFFDWLPGRLGLVLIVIAAIAAFASTGNAGMLSASRYPFAMARDRLMPARFGELGRFQTPTFGIAFTSALMIFCILVLDVEGIAKLASAFQLLLFSMLNLAVIIMRESRIEGYDPGYRSPLYPWMQIFGLLTPYWLIAEMGELALLFTLCIVGASIGWYFYYARGRVERTGAIFHTFARWGKLRYTGLDLELRRLVKEKGLREKDPFEEVVARASVIDLAQGAGFEQLLDEAAAELARRTGRPAGRLRAGLSGLAASGFFPVTSGTALPHLRIAELERPLLLLARCAAGLDDIPRTAPGDEQQFQPIYAVIFLLSPEAEPAQHLRLLGHLASHVDDPEFLDHWLGARNEGELRATLLREERSLTLKIEPGQPTSVWIGRQIRDLRLPPGTLIALIRRSAEGLIPHGSTRLAEGDQLTLIGTPAGIRALAQRFHHPASAGEDEADAAAR